MAKENKSVGKNKKFAAHFYVADYPLKAVCLCLFFIFIAFSCVGGHELTDIILEISILSSLIIATVSAIVELAFVGYYEKPVKRRNRAIFALLISILIWMLLIYN
jgi:hypothetical protein